MKLVTKALVPLVLLASLARGGHAQPTPAGGSAPPPTAGSAAPTPAAGSAAPTPAAGSAAPTPAAGSAAPADAPPAAGSAAPTAAPPAAAAPAPAAPPAAAAAPVAAAAPPVETDGITWWDKMVGNPKDANYEHAGTFWLPPAASTGADGPDALYIAMIGMSAFFFFAITGAIIYLVIRYRHKPGRKPEPSPAHSDALEITWTVIPTIICVLLFVYGWRTYLQNVTVPEPRAENVVYIEGSKWAWNFRYYNGLEDNVLHAPVDQPVKLVMTSRDVLHSFFIPVFRIKQDVVPRRYTYAWFHATKPGVYRVYCTEYCGTDHSMMKTKIVVHEPGLYEKYLSEAYAKKAALAGDKLGLSVYEKKGCNACHTVDGSPRIGPTWKGAFGTDVPLEGGGTVKMDEAYIKTAIQNPNSQIHAGFPPSMPVTPLSDKEIEGVIEYIKTLK
ncbi:MAG: cytochrome c oxidase subunit II [Myxococcales bacterium]|nr:cytochrome c oxidase subunit II [Myxococcales bacterium]MBK7194471.1 cytochrome c oxidase subunit II [Myxococcales bacterium]